MHTKLKYLLLYMSDKHQILQQAYYKNNYPSQDKLHKLVKDKGVSVSDTRKFLKDQLVYQLHFKPKPAPRKSARRVGGLKNEMWMADLIDMQDVGTRNRGYNYILTIIDVFSKKSQAIPLKNKGSGEMVSAFKQAFEETQPQTLKTDNGTEFINREVAKLFEDKNILHLLNQAGNHKEMGNIEKFNQTLLNMLFKSFTDNGNLQWIDILADTVATYNNTYNSAIKSKPNEYDSRAIHNNVVDEVDKAPKLNKGDQVRLRIDKGAFGRGYTQNWSTDLHTIDSVTRGGLYNINGKKYNIEDLQQVGRVETNPFKTTERIIAQPTVRKELNTEKRLKQLRKEINTLEVAPNTRKSARVQEQKLKEVAAENAKLDKLKRKDDLLRDLIERTAGDATMKPRRLKSLKEF
jgi:hypothetical protein